MGETLGANRIKKNNITDNNSAADDRNSDVFHYDIYNTTKGAVLVRNSEEPNSANGRYSIYICVNYC